MTGDLKITYQVSMAFYWWTESGMVRERPEGVPDSAAYLRRAEAEAVLGEVHRRAFEAGRQQAAAEIESVVRATPIRPG